MRFQERLTPTSARSSCNLLHSNKKSRCTVNQQKGERKEICGDTAATRAGAAIIFSKLRHLRSQHTPPGEAGGDLLTEIFKQGRNPQFK
jgi:hypothetical protein